MVHDNERHTAKRHLRVVNPESENYVPSHKRAALAKAQRDLSALNEAGALRGIHSIETKAKFVSEVNLIGKELSELLASAERNEDVRLSSAMALELEEFKGDILRALEICRRIKYAQRLLR